MNLEEMEKRILALEALESVKQNTYRYVNGLMSAEWDEVMACFAEDAVLDVFVGRDKIQGKEIIEKTFREVVSSKHTGHDENDIVCHPIIKIDGEKAFGNWIIYFNQKTDDPNTPEWLQGKYTAEYKSINGEWKFSMLRWRPVLPPGFVMPPPPEK